MNQNQNLQIARSLPRNLRLKGARTSRLRTPGAGFFSYSVPPWIRGEYVASKGKSTLTVASPRTRLWTRPAQLPDEKTSLSWGKRAMFKNSRHFPATRTELPCRSTIKARQWAPQRIAMPHHPYFMPCFGKTEQ